MDSFERSMQISSEVRLDGEIVELIEKPENPHDLQVVELQKTEIQNGLADYTGHVSFDDLAQGEFADIQTKLDHLDLDKSKYRWV